MRPAATLVSILTVALVAVVAPGHPPVTRARDVEPTAGWVTPDPAECRVEPRPVDAILAVAATPVAATRPAAVSAGPPTDPVVAAAVVATVHELFACADAGDLPRLAALFSDGYVRRTLAGFAAAFAFLPTTPTPLPAAERAGFRLLCRPWLLTDGRVAVRVRADGGRGHVFLGDHLFVLVPGRGRFLVDEDVVDGGVASTPPP